jgi:hypothetical protein
MNDEGTTLLELRCWNCVVGTTLLELRCWNCVVGTSLFLLCLVLKKVYTLVS